MAHGHADPTTGIWIYGEDDATGAAAGGTFSGFMNLIGATIITAFTSILAMLTTAASFTPTLANFASATGFSATGRYWITGHICHVRVDATLGTGTITVGDVKLTLPKPMDTTGMIANTSVLNGAALSNDVSAALQYGSGDIQFIDANTVRIMRPSTTGTGNMLPIDATHPQPWATLDQLSIAFSYPI